ncbi:hypothetical protein L6452_20456 [Arctium lappa]|uniref:Uncharacterized protein n=1 Tax=Arctium lappa TaxID=4217 RepID=A0ACB9BAZ4_ARCLA|nr:hypothetical protein L6452_20456 [Arctium lappa]
MLSEAEEEHKPKQMKTNYSGEISPELDKIVSINHASPANSLLSINLSSFVFQVFGFHQLCSSLQLIFFILREAKHQ